MQIELRFTLHVGLRVRKENTKGLVRFPAACANSRSSFVSKCKPLSGDLRIARSFTNFPSLGKRLHASSIGRSLGTIQRWRMLQRAINLIGVYWRMEKDYTRVRRGTAELRILVTLFGIRPGMGST